MSRNKEKYSNKLERLLNYVEKVKMVVMSPDVYKELGLKGSSMQTSKGKVVVKVVEGKHLLGVNDGRTKILPSEKKDYGSMD
jgi:formylmethanofuran dehydrogenase subunit D